MVPNDYKYNLFNKFLGDKVFEFEGPVSPYVSGIDFKAKFKVKLLGDKEMISVGDLRNYVSTELTILDVDPEPLFNFFKNTANEHEFNKHFYYLSMGFKKQLSPYLLQFSIEDEPYFTKIKIEDKKNITEGMSSRKGVVRELVKDVMRVFKKGEGEYSLPEEVSDETEYEFDSIETPFTVEVKIIQSEEIDGFEVDGGYYDDDDTFELEITYNERYFPELNYELIGELNEIIRHELQHLIQKEQGIDRPKKELPPHQYYLQPHEIDAQIKGFRRVSKLRKEPFENIVRKWYYQKDNLTDKEKEKIVSVILKKNKESI